MSVSESQDLPTRVFSPEELDALVQDVIDAEAWAKAMRKHLFSYLQEFGSKSPLRNAVLAPSRPTRKWKVEEEEWEDAVLSQLKKDHPKFRGMQLAALLDEVSPRVPLSPAQLEKVCGKSYFTKTFKSLVKLESSETTLKLGPGVGVNRTETQGDDE